MLARLYELDRELCKGYREVSNSNSERGSQIILSPEDIPHYPSRVVAFAYIAERVKAEENDNKTVRDLIKDVLFPFYIDGRFLNTLREGTSSFSSSNEVEVELILNLISLLTHLRYETFEDKLQEISLLSYFLGEFLRIPDGLTPNPEKNIEQTQFWDFILLALDKDTSSSNTHLQNVLSSALSKIQADLPADRFYVHNVDLLFKRHGEFLLKRCPDFVRRLVVPLSNPSIAKTVISTLLVHYSLLIASGNLNLTDGMQFRVCGCQVCEFRRQLSALIRNSPHLLRPCEKLTASKSRRAFLDDNNKLLIELLKQLSSTSMLSNKERS